MANSLEEVLDPESVFIGYIQWLWGIFCSLKSKNSFQRTFSAYLKFQKPNGGQMHEWFWCFYVTEFFCHLLSIQNVCLCPLTLVLLRLCVEKEPQAVLGLLSFNTALGEQAEHLGPHFPLQEWMLKDDVTRVLPWLFLQVFSFVFITTTAPFPNLQCSCIIGLEHSLTWLYRQDELRTLDTIL